MTNAARCIAVAAALMCASAAFAQTPAPAGTPPVADAGTTIQANCIDENDHYARRGKTPMFTVTLENKCEQRLRCRVFALVTSARGISQGHGTLVLAPKSHGAAAKSTSKNTWAMKVKMIGGNSMSDRECRVF